jgi:hypothetical protein
MIRPEKEAIATDWDLATTRIKEIRQQRDEEWQGLLEEERFDPLTGCGSSSPPPLRRARESVTYALPWRAFHGTRFTSGTLFTQPDEFRGTRRPPM